VYQLDVPVYTEIAFPLLVTISETQSHWLINNKSRFL
jgi:hypothetical protein